MTSQQPATLLDAIESIMSTMSAEDIAYVRKNGMAGAHHGFGTGLRNDWNLWGAQPNQPTVLRDHFKSVYGLGHADDMSGMIFDGLEKLITTGSFTNEDALEKAAHYHRFWMKQGIDPLTQERVTNTSLLDKVKRALR